MDIQSFIQNFAEQFDDIDVSALSPSTKFHELDDYSSIVALSVISMVDEEYGVILVGNDLKNALTIEDLFNTVQSKMA